MKYLSQEEYSHLAIQPLPLHTALYGLCHSVPVVFFFYHFPYHYGDENSGLTGNGVEEYQP